MQRRPVPCGQDHVRAARQAVVRAIRDRDHAHGRRGRLSRRGRERSDRGREDRYRNNLDPVHRNRKVSRAAALVVVRNRGLTRRQPRLNVLNEPRRSEQFQQRVVLARDRGRDELPAEEAEDVAVSRVAACDPDAVVAGHRAYERQQIPAQR